MATWANTSKNTSVYSNIVKTLRGFILKEDSFYLLLETGGKIIIEPEPGGATWDNQTKS